MRTKRNSRLWLGASALVLISVLAVWRIAQVRSPVTIESASGDDIAAAPSELERGELTAVASAATIGSADELAREPAYESHARRIDVERSPETVGPRKTHAQVMLVGSVRSGERHPERTRVQVFADSDQTELREGASGSVLVHAKADATFVADVTHLFIGVNALPGRLRIVAETELGCVATTDKTVNLSVEELATPRLIQLGANVEFRCTRAVTGRVIAPKAVGDVHVQIEAIQSHNWVPPVRKSIDVANGSSFELLAEMAGDFRVVASAAGHGPRIVEFAIESLDRVNLGNILLPDGATCSGTARFCGEIAATKVVTAVPTGVLGDTATPLNRGGRQTLLRFERATGGIALGASARTDEHGRFEFDVLSPGFYELSFEPSDCRAVGLESTSIEVPSTDIELDVRACVLEIEFVLDEASEFIKRVNVEVQLATEGARPVVFEYFTDWWSKRERIARPLGIAATLTVNGEQFDIAPCHKMGAHPLVIELGRGRR